MPRFSRTLLDHAADPQNGGEIDSPDAVGTSSLNGNAPFTFLYLRLKGEQVSEATFRAFGCGVTLACCSVLTERIKGLTIAQCERLEPATVIGDLDGIPEDKKFCAHLTIAALRNALNQLGPTDHGKSET